jgi:hypothetical protein
MMSGELRAELNVQPGCVGEISISVALMTMDMAPAKPLSVRTKLEQKTAGVGPIEIDAQLSALSLVLADAQRCGNAGPPHRSEPS